MHSAVNTFSVLTCPNMNKMQQVSEQAANKANLATDDGCEGFASVAISELYL